MYKEMHKKMFTKILMFPVREVGLKLIFIFLLTIFSIVWISFQSRPSVND